MKVLHIGKAGNMERFSEADSFLHRLEKADLPMGLAPEEYAAAAPDADFLVVDAIAPVTDELMRLLPNLKLVHSEGVAYHLIDTEAAAARGIWVCNSAGMNASAVAEQAVLLMLAMLRDAVNNDAAVRAGRQIVTKEGYMKRGDLRELADCTVGLVGFGGIAKSTAKLLTAFGVKEILVTRRHPLTLEEEWGYGVTFRPLPELLAESDIVSLHLPVTPETAGLADDKFFSAMKPGSLFVNTARGELVDDGALIRALESGRVSMAGLDTVDHEPVAADHPLVSLPEETARRIVFSPHIAGITASSFRRSYAMIWEDIEAAAAGQRPPRAVNDPS